MKILGKKLKKNNVSVDLICFGDISEDQKSKVESFMKAVEHDSNSRVMWIEPGEVYLSDKLLGSAIFSGGDGGQANQGGNAPGNVGGMGGIQVDDP